MSFYTFDSDFPQINKRWRMRGIKCHLIFSSVINLKIVYLLTLKNSLNLANFVFAPIKVVLLSDHIVAGNLCREINLDSPAKNVSEVKSESLYGLCRQTNENSHISIQNNFMSTIFL